MGVASRQSVSQIMDKDKKDEALNAYKIKLMGKNYKKIWDKDFKGNFIFVNYRLELLKHLDKPVVIDKLGEHLVNNKKKAPLFTVEEGQDYRRSLTFKTQRELVNGLRIVSATKRISGMSKHLIPTITTKDALGSYTCGEQITWPPQPPDDVHTNTFPSGKMARGVYRQTVTILDDFHDGSEKYKETLGRISFNFEIKE